MKTLPRVALSALATLLVAAPALAGTLYLPHAESRVVGGELHQTVLWVSNPTDQLLGLNVRFIPTGTAAPAGAGEPYHVAPGASIVLGVAPGGQVGTARIEAADDLVLTGELNVRRAGQLVASAEVPLVGSDRAVGAVIRAHLLTLERGDGGVLTDLGIVNLGNRDGHCQINAVRADGSRIQETNVVAVPAGGHRFFRDALGTLGEPRIDFARFEVMCGVPFFPYATVFGSQPELAKVIVPAASGRSSLQPTAAPPGSPPEGPTENPPPPPTGPPPQGQLLRRDGTFLAASAANGVFEIGLPIPRGQRYSSLTMEFDVTTSGFPTNLFTATVALLRPVEGGTYFAHTVRGDKGKSILDMGVGDGLVHRGDAGVWKGSGNHRVRVQYDTVANRIVWETFRGGSRVERIVGAMGRRNLSHGGEGIKLVFGLPKVYDGAYFPPYRWRFSNLVVHGTPQG
jgi:hypothetical protein